MCHLAVLFIVSLNSIMMKRLVKVSPRTNIIQHIRITHTGRQGVRGEGGCQVYVEQRRRGGTLIDCTQDPTIYEQTQSPLTKP